MSDARSASIKAVIDIGSNSIKLRVARCRGARVDVSLDTTEVVRLGRGFVDGGICERAMDDAVRVITDMVDSARRMGAEPRLLGTMALRMATNAGELSRRIHAATGLDVRVLSGEDEARYAWKGAVAGFPDDVVPHGRDLVMFDTGGGSTELVFGHRGGEPEKILSVPVGAVSLSERFFVEDPVKRSAVDAAQAHVRGLLAACGIERARPDVAPIVVGLGGGVVAMASVKGAFEEFVPVKLHGMELTRRDLTQQIALYSMLTLEERQEVVGLPPSRADAVLGSACIVLCALSALSVPSCILSINGLRHGALIEMFEEEGRLPHGAGA